MTDSIFSNKTIVITGAAGFIGSHLCKELINHKPKKIIALDNLNYGTWNNLDELEGLDLVEMDLASAKPSELDDLMQGVDYLFNLAAEKHNQSKDTPERVISVNVTGTYNLFYAAAKAGAKKIVFTSSLYAYGQMKLPAMAEEDIPAPWTIYGISKLAGEQLLANIHSDFGTDYNVARLFFTYGTHQFAGMGYKSVILKNFEAIMEGRAPTIYGDGKQSLDYVNVKDIVQGLMLLAGDKASREVFNLGSGKATDINELTKIMLKVANSDLEPVYTDADWTQGTARVGDVSKAKEILQWQSSVDLESGLKEVYNWLETKKDLVKS